MQPFRFAALRDAARTGDADAVVLLARQGASLDQVDYDGRSAMHMACVEGNYKVVEVLIQHGANINMKDRWGSTPLQIAVSCKHQMLIGLLTVSKAQLGIDNPASALCEAAAAGDLASVKRLIENSVDPNSGDYDRRCALHISSAEGHDKVVEFLLSSKANANCADRWGGTPLQDALSSENSSCAHLIKAKGGKVPDDFGAGICVCVCVCACVFVSVSATSPQI